MCGARVSQKSQQICTASEKCFLSYLRKTSAAGIGAQLIFLNVKELQFTFISILRVVYPIHKGTLLKLFCYR